MALKTISETTPLGGNRYRVETHFRDGFKEAPEACQNRIGGYEAVPRFFGLPYAKVEHPYCAFRGDPRCVYIVTMPNSGFIVLRKTAFVLLLAFVAALAAFILDGKSVWEYSSIGCLTLGLLCYAAFKHMTAKKSLEWNEYINQGLSGQNQNLEKTNAQIQALQRLTHSLSQAVRVQPICDQMVQTLVGDFKYDSSQIWLLDETGKWLSCRSAKGYTPDMQAYIMNTRFEMGVGWDNPYGLLIQTLEERKTVLVNEVEDALLKLSPRTQDFLRALHLSSFIITPLFDNDVPVGILTAENHDGKKLKQNDRLLFQSVSHTLSSALVKAQLFQDMEEKIAQRTKQLEMASKQLMAAKEMAIQSEKLSSLGQMAAGVAHEINNPLNFLVNILPDVRRDLEGLEKIRDLVIKAGLNDELTGQIKRLDEKYDLESHLSEKDFVFEKIQKALDKSTRIANSLKVFSRSSTKESVASESFDPMLKDVIELLPQKVRGDTRIEIDIPEGLRWNVNKNEIEQAFLALINNAIDAMEQKGRLDISAQQTGNDIMLSFKDSGPGISESAVKKIFDPFYTTKPPGKGTGLGLTIASEIVKKYNGTLSVASEVGVGSTFKILFRK